MLLRPLLLLGLMMCSVPSSVAAETPKGEVEDCLGNRIDDGGFEGGASSGAWTPSSSQGVDLLCVLDSCVPPTGIAPRSGAGFAHFGQTSQAPESATLTQAVQIPDSSDAYLSFYFRAAAASPITAAIFEVFIDDARVFLFSPLVDSGFAAYEQVVIPLADFADGGTRDLTFKLTKPLMGPLDLLVDDVCITAPDAISPVAVCADVTLPLDGNGEVTIDPSQLDGGSTDNLGIARLEVDTGTFTCADLGSQQVTLTVEDDVGNSDSCTATVLVTDDFVPPPSCGLAVPIELQSDGTFTLSSFDLLTAPPVDNCGSVTLMPDSVTFTCDDLGTQPVILTVEDARGNMANCETFVLVQDNNFPCPIRWQNPDNPLDVDDNGEVSSLDVIVLFNYLNDEGAGPVPADQFPPPYYDVNGDGFVSPSDIVPVIIQVLGVRKDITGARVRLAFVDGMGTPISEVTTGASFMVEVFVEGIPAEETPIFAAYLDLVFPTEFVMLDGAVVFGDDYPNVRSVDTATPGLLDELGAVSEPILATPAEYLLCTLPFRAVAPGLATFSTNEAEVLPQGQFLGNFDEAPLAGESIDFGNATLTILPGNGGGEGEVAGEGNAEGSAEGGGEGSAEGAGEGGSEGSVEGSGEGSAVTFHAADTDESNTFGLSEVLRVIQLYNAGEFSCAAAGDATEDGYQIPDGDQNCDAHSSDYNPQDWTINLSELLRLVQLFNARSYTYCPADGTEDGFCPGVL